VSEVEDSLYVGLKTVTWVYDFKHISNGRYLNKMRWMSNF